MLQRLTIGARLALAFSLLALLLLAVSTIGFRGLQQVKSTAVETLEIDAAIALDASRVQLLALQLRRYEKDAFINFAEAERHASYRDRWQDARERLAATLSTAREQAPSDELQALYLEAEAALEEYATGFLAIYRRLSDGEFATTAAVNQAFDEHKDAVYHLSDTAGAIGERAEAHMATATQAIDVSHATALRWLLSVAALALGAAALLSLLITRSIVTPLGQALAITERVAEGDLDQTIQVHGRDETARLLNALQHMTRSLSSLVASIRQAGESVHGNADEIAHGSHTLAARTEQQASALQQSAASMEEITSSVAQNADSTREADDLAEEATVRTRVSNETVSRSVTQIQEVVADAARMDSIIETIDTIAFQTNILALNASVEAAQAGDKGRGFAVVASEVRALASRSADAAGEIRKLLDTTRRQLEACADQVLQSGQSMSDTTTSIERLGAVVTRIGAATREQADGLTQIGTAVAELDSTTQQNAGMVQSTSQAAITLKRQAESLTAMVARFRVAEAPAGAPAIAAPAPIAASTRRPEASAEPA
ncbi:methyl-accepting chemotaxis protein [Halomonas pacifica]|uniref:methyl-accepting chemotaxis protein n=1 Tax=Bisbaumannia pacifica TaxID=77098 RepID=UPI00235926A0|nr:methyl-accepting chemotaxis protein [Halomonas pacifica]MDC8802856.1 methyl-accepting chemotaxis protein [Halomonas pacifica]